MPGEQVLIVDDHPVNLHLAKVVLELAGYEVQGATDAEEALTLLTTGSRNYRRLKCCKIEFASVRSSRNVFRKHLLRRMCPA
jgi:CheY-like chemotaxis protein